MAAQDLSPRAELRCLDGCAGAYPLDQVIYRCPTCNGLLEVVHDLAALRARSAADWKALFDGRRVHAPYPYGSGVWGKKEWVQPHVDDAHVVSLPEGATPMTPARRLAKQLGVGELFVKQCGTSHTGSFKDLGMTVLVSSVAQMVAKGRPIRAVACASTGDTSAALAAYAAAAGLPALVILPRGKISPAQLLQPLAHGAKVLALDTDFDGCMAIVQRLTEDQGVYLANSLNSLRVEGQKTVALEIAQDLGWTVPDWVVIPGGNLGNVSALAAGFTMMRELGLTDRMPRVCVAQAEHANPLYRAVQAGKSTVEPMSALPTLASAIQIGNPVSAKKALRALAQTQGTVEQASEVELAEAAARADATGLFVCPHTAVALVALEKLVKRGTIGKTERVVVVSTASGLKFAEAKLGYHQGTLAAVPKPLAANRPVELPGTWPEVRAAVEKILS